MHRAGCCCSFWPRTASDLSTRLGVGRLDSAGMCYVHSDFPDAWEDPKHRTPNSTLQYSSGVDCRAFRCIYSFEAAQGSEQETLQTPSREDRVPNVVASLCSHVVNQPRPKKEHLTEACLTLARQVQGPWGASVI